MHEVSIDHQWRPNGGHVRAFIGSGELVDALLSNGALAEGEVAADLLWSRSQNDAPPYVVAWKPHHPKMSQAEKAKRAFDQIAAEMDAAIRRLPQKVRLGLSAAEMDAVMRKSSAPPEEKAEVEHRSAARPSIQNFPKRGYECLFAVFRDAHNQAAYGKGEERHANNRPFHEQRMQTISRGLDSPLGLAYQVVKKVEEGLQMEDPDARRRELLGALNYLAGVVIFLDREGTKGRPAGHGPE